MPILSFTNPYVQMVLWLVFLHVARFLGKNSIGYVNPQMVSVLCIIYFLAVRVPQIHSTSCQNPGFAIRGNMEDQIHHYEEIIDAADEVVDSIDRDELARYFPLKSDPDDEGAEKIKKMETKRDQLAEALYQKGLALLEIQRAKGEKSSELAATEGPKSVPDSDVQLDLFEENFKEIQKWVELKNSKYGTLLMSREQHNGRLGTALKVENERIHDYGEPPKKFNELKLSLLGEIGWAHLVSYEKQWMLVRFPSSFLNVLVQLTLKVKQVIIPPISFNLSILCHSGYLVQSKFSTSIIKMSDGELFFPGGDESLKLHKKGDDERKMYLFFFKSKVRNTSNLLISDRRKKKDFY